ncbi:aromatic-ring-hydroxylating dioxygenase subunit beta [Pseudorhodoferax sp.]|uniref:aromatic-ring-hydroxylating dioxygenase subunit beta n=1 Tax=Pseudorhodoferax sp. TaxID=1993553 RepID=UPI002DD662A1|nr:aromatic-ring-hydroxylating dioxygenase subunit beta [Pseudorhodoferax sp.]
MKLDFDTWRALHDLYADYALALDAGELQRWPDFFTDPCVYRLQSRENHERGLPLATLAFESRGMLKDRVFGVTDTIYHDPYYQRHVVGTPRIRHVEPDGSLRCEASYVVLRTKRDALAEILSTGRYVDHVQRSAEGLRFAERLVIFDNDLIPNSLIAPI